MSNSHHHYILTLCQKLDAAGKKPTVGLIKAKADRPLTIPVIISALKHWQESPQQDFAIVPDSAVTQTESLEQRVENLEAEVRALKQVIEALRAK